MTVVVERASLTVAHLSHICVVMTRGPATIEGVRDIHDGADQLARRVQAGIGMLFVVAAQVGPPSGEARRAVAEMFRAMRPHLKIVSAHLAGSGFGAAAKRSVFTWATSHMLGKTPIRAFADLAGATDYLHAQAGKLNLSCPSSVDLQAFVQANHAAHI